MKFAYFKRKIQTGRVDFSESEIQMFNAGESLVPKSPDEMAAQPRPTENNAAASAAAAAASARGISSDESDRRCSIRFGWRMQSQLIITPPPEEKKSHQKYFKKMKYNWIMQMFSILSIN